MFAASRVLIRKGLSYDAAPLFTLPDLDGEPFESWARSRVIHGLGHARLRLRGTAPTVEAEAEANLP